MHFRFSHEEKPMKRLLILPKNILHNPAPNPNLSECLKTYRANGVEIAACEMQGDRGVEQALTQQFAILTSVPQLSHLIMASDTGERAYLLTQSATFPDLRKLRSAACSDGDGFWEEFDVQGFDKPNAGMIEALIAVIGATQILLIYSLPLDKETAMNAMPISGCRVHVQSYADWIGESCPDPWEAVQPASTRRVSLPTNTRRYFEYVNYSENASKFWEIEKTPDELGYWTRYGRIGSKGQSRIRTFTSLSDCQDSYDNIIHSKLRKGYVES